MSLSATDFLGEFNDVTATDFKKHFGKTLDEALRGKAVRITRHGRSSDRLVLLREEDLQRLRPHVRSPLEDLREQFDALVARMQTPRARKAAMSVGAARMEELGQAAVKGVRRRE